MSKFDFGCLRTKLDLIATLCHNESMKSRWFKLLFVVLSGLLAGMLPLCSATRPPVVIGSRWELLVDHWLIEDLRQLTLKLNEPQRREVVLVTDQPWEGPTSAYFSVLKDGEVIRIYYRGSVAGSDHSVAQVTCVVESRDGILFTRPRVGLVEVKGSKDNNIIWQGIESHNFAPFLDTNPNVNPGERYKALAGLKQPGKNWQHGITPGGLNALASADGVHWQKLRPQPVITQGAFDSLNLAFWDAPRGDYVCYSRIFTNGIRAIQSMRSTNFLDWSEGIANHYAAGVPLEHFYTSATVPCPGAEHLLLAFPKRYVPSRKKVATHKETGVSDAVMMTSRDGVDWNRTFLEAWVRPGLDEKNWTDRNNMTAPGIVETAPGEWSLYISEHYRAKDNRLRRLVLPRHRLASVHADARGGEFTTRPLIISGGQLRLNYSTSAAGSLQIELQDEAGKPMAGFTLADMPPLYGDELEAVVKWKNQADLSALKGRVVQLRCQLKDADLYALRFGE